MSYILDALRKAEAERRTGGTSDTLATPAFGVAQAERRSAWRSNSWLWVLPAAAAGALAAAAWFEWKAPVPAKTMPALPQTAALSEPMPQPALPPAPPSPPAPKTLPPVTLHQPPPPVVEAPRPTVQVEAPKRAPVRTAPPAAGQQPQAALATLRELPAEIQHQIPPLSVSGYIYAANPADRSVLINHKLLREGDEVAPGLVLEKLLPNGLVLNYKGYRYRSGY